MSIIPIDTNFTGVQKSLVPKCIIVDIYDLKLNKLINTKELDPSFFQTLCVIAGGSIITNIQIISPIITLDNNDNEVFDISYVLLFQSGTIFETYAPEHFPHFGVNSNAIIQINNNFDEAIPKEFIYAKLGTPMHVNSQIYVIGIFSFNLVSVTIPHVQCLIEYLAE